MLETRRSGATGRIVWLLFVLTTFGIADPYDAEAKEGIYPSWKGQWERQVVRGLIGQPSFDPNKGWGKYQEAPLTPEYEKIFNDNVAAQERGDFFDWRGAKCQGFGMPLIMYPFVPIEFVITPETTYVIIDWVEHTRRIYTDGREWPKEISPTLVGYSIGKWLDTTGDGQYDTLGSRPAASRDRAITTPADCRCIATISRYSRNASISTRPTKNKMHNKITVIDNALTRPWTV